MPFQPLLSELDDKARETLDTRIELVHLDEIPRDSKDIYIEAHKWIYIANVTVVFIDMVGSSNIDFSSHTRTSARIYETFTGSLVRIMENFDAAYIDIQGDGVLALFDGSGSYAKGFIAATTFRTYVKRYLASRIERLKKNAFDLRTRTGLSYGKIIVKRVGTRKSNNEVWAYQRVNQAVKLSSLAEEDCLVASPEAYEQLSQIDWIENSCPCNGRRWRLWSEVEHTRIQALDSPLVQSAYELKSLWCEVHGEEYMANIIDERKLDLPKLKSREVNNG